MHWRFFIFSKGLHYLGPRSDGKTVKAHQSSNFHWECKSPSTFLLLLPNRSSNGVQLQQHYTTQLLLTHCRFTFKRGVKGKLNPIERNSIVCTLKCTRRQNGKKCSKKDWNNKIKKGREFPRSGELPPELLFESREEHSPDSSAWSSGYILNFVRRICIKSKTWASHRLGNSLFYLFQLFCLLLRCPTLQSEEREREEESAVCARTTKPTNPIDQPSCRLFCTRQRTLIEIPTKASVAFT